MIILKADTQEQINEMIMIKGDAGYQIRGDLLSDGTYLFQQMSLIDNRDYVGTELNWEE